MPRPALSLFLPLFCCVAASSSGCGSRTTPGPEVSAPVKAEKRKPQLTARQQRMLSLLGFIDRTFAERYAPATYKRKRFGWEQKRQIAAIERTIRADPRLSTAELQRLLYGFVRSPRDIHTGITFKGGKAVWLGLHVMKADGAYLLAWIDRRYLPEKEFPFSIGDRLVRIGGESVEAAITRTRNATRWASTAGFDQAFAEWFMTFRATSEWGQIPEAGAPIELVLVRQKDAKEVTARLKWLDEGKRPPARRCPFWGKTRLGYLPPLGPVVWQPKETRFFPAYVFRSGAARYGYLRIHTYKIPKPQERLAALEELDRLLRELKKRKVSKLVIDQTGNGGGNFLFGFALISRLTEAPLHTPRQHFLITAGGKVLAVDQVQRITQMGKMLAGIKDDKAAERALGSHPFFSGPLNFVPRNLRTVESLVRFSGFFDKAWRPGQGRTFTAPHFLLLDRVQPAPSPSPRFTGPILLLIDALNLSAAEYVAATLKDNGRATLMGTTTSGAGGDQRGVSLDNVCTPARQKEGWRDCLSSDVAELMKEFGIQGITYTVSLGVRVDQHGRLTKKFENEGVEPDIEYRLTRQDIQQRFGPYRRRIREVLAGL